MTVRVAVGGATGKIGRVVCDKVAASYDLELTGAVVSENGGHVGESIDGVIAVGPDGLDEVLRGCDVYVDLTTPAAASKTVARVPRSGANLILGTTSVDPNAIKEMTRNVEDYGTSALVSANFEIGVNVFWKVCEVLARYLPDYDVEVVETHHAQKMDAPSGTAMEAVRRVQSVTGVDDVEYGRHGVTGPRSREICVHSIRAGDIVGDHTVIFAKNMERVELTHKAISREALADGCIESIRWMADRRDGRVHSMSEVLGL